MLVRIGFFGIWLGLLFTRKDFSCHFVRRPGPTVNDGINSAYTFVHLHEGLCVTDLFSEKK